MKPKVRIFDPSNANHPPHPLVVVMGVSGSGKSTIGLALAHHLGCSFQEGDALHPAANRAKMARGEPLTDADRAPWLEAVAAWLAARAAEDVCGVITCSALKRIYRDHLRASVPDLAFIFPDPPATLLRERVETRTGHFMPASLLQSQLDTLEPPGADEQVLRLSGDETVETACRRAADWLADARRRTI
jgi:gluconokinase